VAVALGILASIGLSRSRFRGAGLVTALVLVPLVVPLVVLGISLLLLFHVLGIQLSIFLLAVVALLTLSFGRFLQPRQVAAN